MRSLELRVPPLVLVLIVAMGMALTAFAVPGEVVLPARQAIAAAIVVAGVLVAVTGVLAFRRQQTTVNPMTPGKSSSLVATGIYRFSRNPMYLGMLLVLGGWGVFLANTVAVLWLPGFVVYMNWFQIRPEERALTERFGDEYLAYCRSVRRWV
jgi:protein-S-isoprenylcysteine O-methyltransferase Ste14